MRVGSDTGGTFTDLVTEDGRTTKVPSVREDPGAAVWAGLEQLGTGRPEQLGHGTTVATNALLERRGAPTALVTTEGLADVIEIARQDRPSLYDPSIRRPDPLVPRGWRIEVAGRLAADGREVAPLDVDGLRRVLDGALPADVEAIAVVLLHADLNPVHEQALAAMLAERASRCAAPTRCPRRSGSTSAPSSTRRCGLSPAPSWRRSTTRRNGSSS